MEHADFVNRPEKLFTVASEQTKRLFNNVIWIDKLDMFGHNAQHQAGKKPNALCQHKHLIPTVKHNGGGLINWACFAATGPQYLPVIEVNMKSSVYQSIPESYVR